MEPSTDSTWSHFRDKAMTMMKVKGTIPRQSQALFRPPFAKNASCPTGRQCSGVVVREKVPHCHGGDPHGGSLLRDFFPVHITVVSLQIIVFAHE
jgi:hypothetical protein